MKSFPILISFVFLNNSSTIPHVSLFNHHFYVSVHNSMRPYILCLLFLVKHIYKCSYLDNHWQICDCTGTHCNSGNKDNNGGPELSNLGWCFHGEAAVAQFNSDGEFASYSSSCLISWPPFPHTLQQLRPPSNPNWILFTIHDTESPEPIPRERGPSLSSTDRVSQQIDCFVDALIRAAPRAQQRDTRSIFIPKWRGVRNIDDPEQN